MRHPYFHPDPRLHDFAWSMHHLAGSWIDVEADGYPDRELPTVELDASPDGESG